MFSRLACLAAASALPLLALSQEESSYVLPQGDDYLSEGAFLDQFEHPDFPTGEFWGHDHPEAYQTDHSDVTIGDLWAGYDENIAFFEGMTHEEIVEDTGLPDDRVASIMHAIKTREEAEAKHGRSLRSDANKALMWTAAVCPAADYNGILACITGGNNVIELTNGVTYTWPANGRVTVPNGVSLTLQAADTSPTAVKPIFQGYATDVMFQVNGGSLIIDGAQVLHGQGELYTQSTGFQCGRAGFILQRSGSTKLYSVDMYFWPWANVNDVGTFNVKQALQNRAAVNSYVNEFNQGYKAAIARGVEPQGNAAASVCGWNIYVELGTIKQSKVTNNFWPAGFYSAKPVADPTNNAQMDAFIQGQVKKTTYNIKGGYVYVENGNMKTTLTKYSEFIPLAQMGTTKTITIINVSGLLGFVENGQFMKTLSNIFITQRGYPYQVLIGPGLLFSVNGQGFKSNRRKLQTALAVPNFIMTGGSLIVNSPTPLWISAGSAIFLGAGNMIITGVFFNLNEGASLFIGAGNVLFNGAGTMILTGAPMLVNRGAEAFIGCGTATFLGAGVQIVTGSPIEVFVGATVRIGAGYGVFQGAGHFLILGSPLNYRSGALALFGLANYAFLGAGGQSLVGTPIVDTMGSGALFGAGMYAFNGAGKLMIAGMPIIEFAGAKACFGAGCVVFVGAGLILLEAVAVIKYAGARATFGQGLVVFLGGGTAHTWEVQVDIKQGINAQNEEVAGVYIGSTELMKALGLQSAEGDGNSFVLADSSISMAADGAVDLAEAISVDGSCRVCGSGDLITGAETCESSETCAESDKIGGGFVSTQEVALVTATVFVACTTEERAPALPTKPSGDASVEALEEWRAAKSLFKADMRNNRYGCTTSEAVEEMLSDIGLASEVAKSNMVSVAMQDYEGDGEAECSRTESYVATFQVHDYAEAENIRLELEALLGDINADELVEGENAEICSVQLANVEKFVFGEAGPEIDVEGEVVRGAEVVVSWTFPEPEGIEEVNVELAKLRDSPVGVFDQYWSPSTVEFTKTLNIVKNSDMTEGTFTFQVPQDLSSGEYVFRVTGSGKVGNQITGMSDPFTLELVERSVGFPETMGAVVKAGDKITIPIAGFEDTKSVKVFLATVDPATQLYTKVAVISKKVRSSEGLRPITWEIPADIPAGNNYVIAVVEKSRSKSRSEKNKVLSQTFSISK